MSYKKHMNQATLESVLDMWLSSRDLKYLKTEWHSFYMNPTAYPKNVIKIIKANMIKNQFAYEMEGIKGVI